MKQQAAANERFLKVIKVVKQQAAANERVFNSDYYSTHRRIDKNCFVPVSVFGACCNRGKALKIVTSIENHFNSIASVIALAIIYFIEEQTSQVTTKDRHVNIYIITHTENAKFVCKRITTRKPLPRNLVLGTLFFHPLLRLIEHLLSQFHSQIASLVLLYCSDSQ